jgi:mannose-6-phosphate isomerase-like protein (cupin superfamily)
MDPMLNMYNPYGLNNAYLPSHCGKKPVYSPAYPYMGYGMDQFCSPYQSLSHYPFSAPGQQYMPAGGCGCDRPVIQDYGPAPFVMDIEEAAMQNNTFRTALWTGKHLQVTLMSIRPGEDIGLEMHPELDQFIRIENGHGIVMMGDTKDRLDFRRHVNDDYIIIIPAGKWHNLINTGHEPIKLYSIYAPPEHPHGTVHQTKADAEAAGHHH